jgi:plastocyanin
MINRGVTGTFVVATLATIFTVAATMNVLTTFPSGQQANAQQNETGATTTTANQSMTPTASNNKNFTLYNTEVEGLDDTYIYTLPVIAVNSGDSVTVSLHNVAESGGAEDTTEGSTEGGAENTTEGSTEGGAENTTEGRHSFTIDAQPYNVDIDTAAGEVGNSTFTADQAGIFQYHCKYHPETMRGELIVLPKASEASTS